MLDFIKEETTQKTMTANVILTFDTVINEFGTQQIFDVEFTIADSGDETVFNMLSAINEYVDCHNLPKKELWKISTSANWTKIANEHDLSIQIIDDTNGKWQFVWKDRMTDYEKSLAEKFGFGSDLDFSDDFLTMPKVDPAKTEKARSEAMRNYKVNEYTSDAIDLQETITEILNTSDSPDLKKYFECIVAFINYDREVHEERVRLIETIDRRTPLGIYDFIRMAESSIKYIK